METITKSTLWTANSVKPTHEVRFMDMNNGHLANVFQLNLTRLAKGMDVMDIVAVLIDIARDRKLNTEWMTAYHPFDPHKPYLLYGEKESNYNEKMLISKSTVLDLMEILSNMIEDSDHARPIDSNVEVETLANIHGNLDIYLQHHEDLAKKENP